MFLFSEVIPNNCPNSKCKDKGFHPVNKENNLKSP